ncbi:MULTISPECIES: PLP-dependent aminotransferase family protein [unclassified Roseovarius]|uniref:aminotransferase-like domain-containing protein n=1 Tax=unclassified Roseovarius TaxID=2614913 RepID=UPI00273DCC95|nr:PLP-dependent aminotransferase family protein [Roseovarius sp. MMSF_3350]
MGTNWTPDLAEGAGPKYKALIQAIRAGIGNQSLVPGDKLPPVRDLAWRLGITPGTVARAYSGLTDDGTLVAEVGRGTFVAEPKPIPPDYFPIEADTVEHNSGGDGYAVNMISPHLPSVGQARLIRQLLAQIAEDPPSGVMHYPSRRNMQPARAAAARFLSRVPLGRFTEDDVVLTHGGQNAITLIMQTVLCGRRPTILVEELCYPGVRRAADLMRAEVIPVTMDAHGLNPGALEAAAHKHQAQMLFTSAEVHNPTCVFTPAKRRDEIVEVARRCDLQILEDDCYRIGPSQAPAYRMLAPERGWYVASLSKSLTPALRVGFALAPEGQSMALRRAVESSFFGLATPISDLIAALLTHDGLDGLMDAVRERSDEYIQCALNVLGRHDVKWRRDVPFLWLTLPPGWRTSAFCQAAAEQGVQVRSAEDFACRDAASPHAVRMAVNAGVSLDSFEAAMQRLRRLLDNPPEGIGV